MTAHNLFGASRGVDATRQANKSAGKCVDATREANIYRGWKSDIARQLGVSRATVSLVYKGRRTSAAVARAIAATLAKSHAELWPGRYPQAEFLESLAASRKAVQA